MVKLILRLLLFLSLNISFLTAVLFFQNVEGTERKNNETESNLLITPQHVHYDYVFLGTSHGRTFSRYGNHQRVESILGANILNLSVGSGGGVLPAKTSLEYFFERGNSATTLVYFLDPWVLYYKKYNEEHVFMRNEPLSLHFAWLLIKNGFDKKRLLEYVRSKYEAHWRQRQPDYTTKDTSVVKRSDSLALLTIKGRSPGPLDEGEFQRHCQTLQYLFQLAQTKGAKIKVIIPPTLIGEISGHQSMIKKLKELQAQFDMVIVDHTSVVSDEYLFSDHDHLNSKGVEFYTTQFLKPILSHNK